MSQKLGRRAVNPRIADGTLIIKHILRSTDEDTIELIKESPYLQYFPGYPEWVRADAIYGSRENRAYMKEHKIRYTGHALGCPPGTADPEHREHEAARKQQGKQRSRVEGIFGNSKRKYDLDLVKAKTKETSESWIAMVYLVMNIALFLRVIFWPILKLGIFWFNKDDKNAIDRHDSIQYCQCRT